MALKTQSLVEAEAGVRSSQQDTRASPRAMI